jgi:hypothetical protein
LLGNQLRVCEKSTHPQTARDEHEFNVMYCRTECLPQVTANGMAAGVALNSRSDCSSNKVLGRRGSPVTHALPFNAKSLRLSSVTHQRSDAVALRNARL